MFDLQRMCVIVASLLTYSVVLIFVVTKYYNTSQTTVYKEPRNAKFMQYRGFYSSVETAIQQESKMTQSKENFDYERLQQNFRNEACPKRNLTRPNNSIKRTGLLSFPASGNTWTRHLIQQLTGFETCPARMRDACIVYKSHKSSTLAMAPFDKAIIIIRNPMYLLKSFFHFKYGEQEGKNLSERNRVERHKGFADTSLFQSQNICKAASVETKYTKNCLRATSIQLLNDKGYEAYHIMIMSGHKSEASLRSYIQNMFTTQKKSLSTTLSSMTGDSEPQQVQSNNALVLPSKSQSAISSSTVTN
ncbi:uncharacterized protein LOC110450501 [Mizuhopecten yessoensis]|uniref:uncharacterized protein LOC110450501 n=1 Tax=Mizuhopecten yessoensis TaxID=6573 RepID=UPI000B45EBB6|nr:uncharacterized protein LOC110450501 [Mizuhopecten yessoensis]